MTEFWELPGPSTFLRALADDLRGGSNIAVIFPEHSPEGWLPALRVELCDSLPHLEELSLDGKPPVSAIHRHLGLEPASPRAHISDLCGNPAFRGRLLYVATFSPEPCRAWRQFLASYEDVCRAWSLAERTLFIVGINGSLVEDMPTPANLLRVHHWNDCLDSLDIRLYAAGLLSAAGLSAWQRNLAVTLLGELALWDPQVCAAGASLSLAELIEPSSWLAEIARSRGWSPTLDPKSSEAGRCGIRHTFEGNSRVHSAWLAAAHRVEALDYRVWNAQVTSLFPLLERHRRALLKTYSAMNLLRVPWNTQFGRIDRIEDLELNHIADQFSRHNSRGLRDTCDFICWLRDLRNDLAHLSPIPAARLIHPAFLSRLSQCQSTDDI